MIQSNVYGGDLQSRLYFPPYLWWMSEISSLPLNDFNISSPSLLPFIDLVITLSRQGFDFSSEEMSENNHFHRQLTLLAPFPFRIGCVLTPYWSCLLPTSKRLVPTCSISRSTTELYVHHYHVQYQIVKLLKINRLHHQPVGKSSHKSKTTKQPNYL